MKPLRPHEVQALEFLSLGPDRITVIENDETFAAALLFIDLEKRGLVHIDKDEGMLITISAVGTAALANARGAS